MKANLNILQGKYLAKIRGITELPPQKSLQDVLIEEPTMEEMVEVGKMITKFYLEKIKIFEEEKEKTDYAISVTRSENEVHLAFLKEKQMTEDFYEFRYFNR